MKPDQIEANTIAHLVGILATMCAANEDKIINLLTGYLWDEAEARMIEAATKAFEAKQ